MRAGELPSTCRAVQRGFVMVAWLIAVALLAAVASTMVTRWADEIRRDKEQELMVVGNEIAGAIASYQRASAGSGKRHPPELVDLLEDRRAFGMSRHLRRLPIDPVTRDVAWGVLRATDGGVMGVYSLSEEKPMRQVATRLEHVDLPVVSRYQDWKFVPREGAR